MAKKPASVKTQKMVTDIVVHIFLAIVAIVWLIPFIWLVAHSFRGESTGQFTPGFFPTEFTFDNYIKLFTETDSMNFPRTFMNTFVIASSISKPSRASSPPSSRGFASMASCPSRIPQRAP